MKVYLVEQPTIAWGLDRTMVIIAEDEQHAKRKSKGKFSNL